jgi:two-component system NtrC family sensor kinase
LELAPPQSETGAEFVIRLPVVAPETEAPTSTGNHATQVGGDHYLTVLVVDDEPDIAQLVSDVVSDRGFKTVIARSGHAAENLLANREGEIGAILCDIRMPDGDGPALYDWLSVNRPALTRRIAFITGDTLGPSAGRFLARTGCPIIEKPFTPDDIVSVLKALTAA